MTVNKIKAAHIREDGTIQTVKAHNMGTALRAQKFGQCFQSGNLTYSCGLLHDIGKYSEKFQKRIYEGGNFTDHSTAGAIEINKRLPNIGFLLAYCIAGHHAGLPDGGSQMDTADEPTLNGRLKRTPEPYDAFTEDIDEENSPPPFLPIRPLEKKGFSLSFYIRMLFSCLVDADFLDTEEFMNGDTDRGCSIDISELVRRLEIHLKKFDSPSNELNKKRCEILHNCIDKAAVDKGLYTLTVPTGGGKTIASLAFALKHAKKNHIKRVIYVIPYTSIIEQNAAVFKNILGEEAVLEHHSNFAYDDMDSQGGKQKLATENWDMPVIVTTTVQFFESVFSNKSSKCRKLHNIANSVLIFDEAQMIPIPYLRPCIRALSELVYNYGSTVLLCSATQPALNTRFPKELSSIELCENIPELFEFFRRTRLIDLGELQDEELAERLNAQKQVLCIVNTRKQAQKIFIKLDKQESFHLSTLMYPQHRKRILNEIRSRLKNGLPCRVISTSLIEAGVDVDFPVVYRAEAGLDSEIQAAGRCNREGKRSLCPVYIFRPAEEYRCHLPAMLRRPTEITRVIANRYADCTSPQAITDYFSSLYTVEGTGLDIKNVVDKLENGANMDFSFPFAEVASGFKLIENATYAVVIPREEEAKELVRRLKNGEQNRAIMRKLQQYTVNVYACNYEALLGAGSIEALDEDLAVLTDDRKYSDQTGLDARTDSGIGVFV